MEPSRVFTISKWPELASYREIQVFLWFADFYRRFIIGFSRINVGLTGLLMGETQQKFKRVLFDFTSKARTSFFNLQKAFPTALLFRHFDLYSLFEWKRMLQALLSLLFSHKLIKRLEISTK